MEIGKKLIEKWKEIKNNSWGTEKESIVVDSKKARMEFGRKIGNIWEELEESVEEFRLIC